MRQVNKKVEYFPTGEIKSKYGCSLSSLVYYTNE